MTAAHLYCSQDDSSRKSRLVQWYAERSTMSCSCNPNAPVARLGVYLNAREPVSTARTIPASCNAAKRLNSMRSYAARIVSLYVPACWMRVLTQPFAAMKLIVTGRNSVCPVIVELNGASPTAHGTARGQRPRPVFSNTSSKLTRYDHVGYSGIHGDAGCRYDYLRYFGLSGETRHS